MKELLIRNGFDVVDMGGTFRVFYEKGKAFETFGKLREILPNVRIDSYYGFLEIVIGY